MAFDAPRREPPGRRLLPLPRALARFAKLAPWPERVFFYELQDDADPDVPKWGLLRSGGRPKPAYRALRDWIGAAAGPGEEEPPQPPRSRPKSIDPD